MRAMMTPVKRSRLIPALALTAALTLAGCAGVGSDLGVSVEGEEFSVAELQEATGQLNEATGQPTGPQQVIADLVLLPLLDSIFAGSPAQLNDALSREMLSGVGITDPGPATLAAVRSRQYQAVLQNAAALQGDPEMTAVVERASAVTQADLAAIDVEVNPRYGSWDVANGGLVAEIPSWIQAPQDS